MIPLSKYRKLYLGVYFVSLFPIYIKGYLNPLLHKVPFLFWLVDGFVFLIISFLLLFFCKNRLNVSLDDLGYRNYLCGNRNYTNSITITILLIPIVFIFYALLRKLSFYVFPTNWGFIGFGYSGTVPKFGFLHYIALWYLSLTAGFIEETQRTLCRMVFGKKAIDIAVYIIFSSFFFSLLHWHQGVQSIFLTFCLGLLFSSIYIFLKNIWPLIISHILLDLFLLS